jgi:hypothetical protein
MRVRYKKRTLHFLKNIKEHYSLKLETQNEENPFSFIYYQLIVV